MQNAVVFEDFTSGFGFSNYPFNSFTAESEKERQSDIFVATRLYSPIVQAFNDGQTIILSGDRGTGKTSVIYDFSRNAGRSVLFCQVDDYSDLPLGFTETQFYRFVIKSVTNEFFKSAADGRYFKKSLSEDERLLLAYFYVNFATDATRGLAQRATRKIQESPVQNFGRAIYNFFRSPLNIFASAGVNVLADIVSKATGSVPIHTKAVEYFPEIKAAVESEFAATEATLEALRRLNSIVKKTGYNRISIVFDKIDEDNRFDNAAEEIADFIAPILSNNKFLLDDSIQIVFSLWIVPLNFLKDKVRTQKILSPSLKWAHDDLARAFDRRIEVFSKPDARNFNDVFNADVSIETKTNILDLCNGNPRDLWHLFDKIFRCQYNIDPLANHLSEEACDKGMINFVREFNLYEYYPRKANARANSMDVYAYVKHLLKLEDHTFTRNQLNDRAGTGSSTLNYTVGMENLGLIEKDVSDKGENLYAIRDPKIRFALERFSTVLNRGGIPLLREF